MKTEKEIKEKIRNLYTEINLLFTEKRQTKSCTTAMSRIDGNIDNAGKQIRILKWVLN